MSRPVTGVSRPAAQDRTPQERSLRESARQLEGVFVQQLYKAMRETVPQGEGIVSGGAGEDMFTGLMDQHLAAETPSHWGGGLSEALYRQLRGRLPVAAAPLDSDSSPR
ncbi:MAG: rod-binding protein [Gemmatimonas sp.]|uniref:rod-binding protein n=1 Tax=Gemmatimonas sp. TaxID=1962908 RepID=UPI00391F164F|nr:rod-binding protein [Gemmatimonadota bacterium]